MRSALETDSAVAFRCRVVNRWVEEFGEGFRPHVVRYGTRHALLSELAADGGVEPEVFCDFVRAAHVGVAVIRLASCQRRTFSTCVTG